MPVHLLDATRRLRWGISSGLLVALLGTGCGNSPPGPDLEARACSIWVYGRVRLSPDETEGRIFRSRDAGRTWVTSRNPVPELIDRRLEAFYFSSPEKGWIATGTSFYRTLDGGDSWTRVLSLREQAVPGIGEPFLNATVDKFSFFDDRRGLIFLSGQLRSGGAYPLGYALRTEDGGSTWTGRSLHGIATNNIAAPAKEFDPRFSELCTAASGKGLALITRGWMVWDSAELFRLLVTEDFGKTWRLLPRIPLVKYDDPGWLTHLTPQCTGGSEIFLSIADATFGVDPLLLRSGDAGRSWQDLPLSQRVLDRHEVYEHLKVLTDRTIVAQGFFGEVHRSHDLGQSWHRLTGISRMQPNTLGAMGDFFPRWRGYSPPPCCDFVAQSGEGIDALIFRQGESTPESIPLPPDAGWEDYILGDTVFALLEQPKPGEEGCPAP